MYALAGLLILLALYFLIQGTLLRPSRHHRLAAVICLVGAILTHSVAVVALPVWALALVICLVIGQRQFNLAWYRQKSIMP